MSTYRIATGHNIALASLTAIDPQPRDGAIRALRTYSDTSAQERAYHAFLQWDVLESAEQYQDLLEQFELLDALYNKVTIYTKDSVFNWARFNGIAIRPEIPIDGSWSRYFARNFVIVIRNLEPLA